ncbi:unnamed protein product, partial [Discosporangium mesarthrocarpum]
GGGVGVPAPSALQLGFPLAPFIGTVVPGVPGTALLQGHPSFYQQLGQQKPELHHHHHHHHHHQHSQTQSNIGAPGGSVGTSAAALDDLGAAQGQQQPRWSGSPRQPSPQSDQPPEPPPALTPGPLVKAKSSRVHRRFYSTPAAICHQETSTSFAM